MSREVRKRWILRQGDYATARALSQEAKLPLTIASLLVQRDVCDSAAAQRFLFPRLDQLPSPWQLPGMEQATTLLAEAIGAEIPIIIYGDYDVDGVTATALLHDFFQDLGRRPVVVQPNRFDHGYGLHQGLLAEISQQLQGRPAVLITVDCGITDVEAVATARGLGMTTIITDHHQPPADLPAADAIINPHLPGCAFDEINLAGVGVAFYLAMGLRAKLRQQGRWAADADGSEPNLKKLLDLVALGTVCDMVPLTRGNRILVKAGLEVIAAGGRPGIRALCQQAGLAAANRALSAYDLSHRLGPRLNAAGRMATSANALRLLCTTEESEAISLARKLEELNQQRRTETDDLFAICRKMAGQQLEEGRHSLVLWGRGWHKGVMGIVASRLVDEFYLPTLVLGSAEDGGVAKGSGRSIEGIDLYQSLGDCPSLLQFGGHPMAAGLSVALEDLSALRDEFEKSVVKQIKNDEILQKKLAIDCQVGNSSELLFDNNFFRYYAAMEPFGIGNPEPVFSCKKTLLDRIKRVGDGHLRFRCKVDDKTALNGIGFRFGNLVDCLADQILAMKVRRNYFRGEMEWQLHLLDAKSGGN